jgi:hypothetical protein
MKFLFMHIFFFFFLLNQSIYTDHVDRNMKYEYSDNKIVFKCILQHIRTLQKIVRYEITSNNFSKCMHIAF